MTESNECPICQDTGWEDCNVPWCGDPDHGAYCRCSVGRERAEEELHSTR